MTSSRNFVVLSALMKWIKGTRCFKFLRERLPVQTTRDLDRLCRLRCKIVTEKTRIIFYQECIRNHLYPRSFSKLLLRSRLRNTVENMDRLCLSHIDSSKSKLAQFIETQACYAPLLEGLSLICRIKFTNFCSTIVARTRTRCYNNLKRSLNTTEGTSAFPSDLMKHILNLSDVNLNQIQMEALSLGLSFKVPAKRIDRAAVEAEFENLYDQLTELKSNSPEDENWFKSKLIDVTNRICVAPVHQTCPLRKEHMKALQELKQNENLVILRPDKGSGTVLMNKSDYVTKMNSILSDNQKFSPDVQTDNVHLVEKQITRELHLLLLHGFISQTEFTELKPIGCHSPQLYGLPKIHKSNVPLRPILSMNYSPYHKLAQWLVKLLKPVREELARHSLRNTYELLPMLQGQNLSDIVMCSFDVQSLFTNVPLEETVNFLCDYLSSHSHLTRIPAVYLKQLILLCTKDIKFYFDGKSYKQIDGVAMGSPLGPTLADIFMAKLELALQNEIQDLPLYKRYLDDILIFATDKEQIDCLFSHFNSQHPNISFTCEFEEDNRLPFLDVCIIRNADGTMSRTVYRKPTWTGQYLNFLSFCPLQYKRSLVRTLFYRARRICTSDKLEAEFRFLKDILRANNYPERFIECHAREKQESVAVQTARKKQVFLRLPYLGEAIFQQLTLTIKKALRRTFNAAELRTLAQTKSLPLPLIKTPIPTLSTTHCIYQFTCSCGDKYIGRTDRRLETRMKEHVPKRVLTAVTHTPTRLAMLKGKITSSITRHLLETKHEVNLPSAFQVIARCNQSKRLKFLEAILINRLKPALCAQKDLRVTLRLPWFF